MRKEKEQTPEANSSSHEVAQKLTIPYANVRTIRIPKHALNITPDELHPAAGNIIHHLDCIL